MDSFELNKVAAALLIALLVAAVSNQISKSLVQSVYSEKKSYHVEMPDQQASSPLETKPETAKDIAPLLVKSIFKSIVDIQEKKGLSIVLVEQNAKQALAVADEGYVLQTGELKLSGPAHLLRQSDLVRQAYLGGSV